MKRSFLSIAALATLCACGPTGEVASAGSTPAIAAAVADATLPPPSQISPLAATSIDDYAIKVAFDAVDAAASAADAYLALRPQFAGTPPAVKLADALVGATTWLNIASQAQRAGQAESYAAALQQASAAMAGARGAIAAMKGN